MGKDYQDGTWLLIDAAGPRNLIGLIREGAWMAREEPSGDFLESLGPTVEDILKPTDTALESLSGTIYASGPGSTLGLRLAAMFIRSLMEVPHLGHWRCLQYQNMEVALASLTNVSNPDLVEAIAPWRRDRYHHSVMNPDASSLFLHTGIDAEEAKATSKQGFSLGRRPPQEASSIHWRDFPYKQIPDILNAFPELLVPMESPEPYVAEIPEFAKWAPVRHTAK